MARTGSAEGASGAELVQIAFARDPVEAGMIQGLLEEGGIPSLLQATGVDGPAHGIGLLAPGPQRVMVRAPQAEAARRALAEVLVEEQPEREQEIANARDLGRPADRGPRAQRLLGAYAKIWFWSLASMGAAFGAFLLLRLA